MLVKLDPFPRVQGENKTCLKPPPSKTKPALVEEMSEFPNFPMGGICFLVFFLRIGKQEFTETKCSDLFTFVGRLFQKVRTQGMTLNLRSFLDSFPCLHHIKI